MSLDIAFRIVQYGIVASTQRLLQERLLAGEDIHGLVVRAEAQTHGYGRRGERWLSGVGGSYQSLAVHDSVPPSFLGSKVTVAVAVGIAETFREYGAKVSVKWPNDLYYLRKKLGGILCEYRKEHLLIGVGVNVANEPRDGAVALRGWDIDGVHGAVLRGIQVGLDLVEQQEALLERFGPVDALAGLRVTVDETEAGARMVTGYVSGLATDGALLIQDGRGMHQVRNGRIVEIAWPT